MLGDVIVNEDLVQELLTAPIMSLSLLSEVVQLTPVLSTTLKRLSWNTLDADMDGISLCIG